MWPLALLSAVILGLSAWTARRRDPVLNLRPWRDGLFALLAPLTLPIWSTLTAGVEKGGRAPIPWASIVLGLLALTSVVAAIVVLYRGRTRWYVYLPMVVTVMVACFLGLFVGGMQIVDDWV